jgi:hypothetical protein
MGLQSGRMVRQATRLLSTTDLTSEFIDHFIRRRLLAASLPVDRAQRVPNVSRTLSAQIVVYSEISFRRSSEVDREIRLSAESGLVSAVPLDHDPETSV